MISIPINSISDQEKYKLLTGAIVPWPIALITTLSSEGVINVAPFTNIILSI